MTEGKSVDDTILRYADSRSAEEISKMLGGMISPMQVAERRNFLLTSRNPLTDAQQETLVLYKMRSLLAEMEGKYLDMDNAKFQLQALKTLGDQYDKRKAATDDQLSRLYANQAQIMFDAIRMALTAVVKELKADDEEASAAMRKALPEAILIISERNAGNEIEQ